MKLPKFTYSDRWETKGLRIYLTERGELPGVTSVLNITEPSHGLDIWKQRLGIYADEIQGEARNRGIVLHDALQEIAGKNTIEPPSWLEQDYYNYWESLKPFLSTIQEDILSEAFVWSRYGYAGTFDRLCKISGDYYVVDWKTSDSPKSSNTVKRYKIQLAAYAGAINWVYRDFLKVSKAKIVVALPYTDAQVITLSSSEMKKYWNEWLDRLNIFNSLKKRYMEGTTHGIQAG